MKLFLKRLKSNFFTILFLSVILNTGNAQVFWTERFENNCTSKCKADAYTGPNGAWKIVTLPGSIEGANANNWFVSCAVEGQAASSCYNTGSSSCTNGNNSLHISSVDDLSADYTKDAPGKTDKRVESPTINCAGKSNVQIEFDFICRADTSVNHIDHCDLEYSTDNGVSWNVLNANLISYACPPSGAMWLKFVNDLPASVNNNPNVKIGFHWKNEAPTSLNIAFAVDSIRLSTKASAGITTGAILGGPFCACSTIKVPYNATGNVFSSGNIFTAELSDATGNFATPVSIGSIISTADTGSISAFIPCNTPPGNGYRIRIMSSTPPLVGTDNGVNLTILAPIQVKVTPNPDTVCLGSTTVLKVSGGDPGNYLWFLSPSTVPISTADSLLITPVVNATYVVIGQKGTCLSRDSTRVVIQIPPVVNVTNDTTCEGLGAVIKATGGTKYLWGDGSTKDSLVVFPTKDTMIIVNITKGYCTVKDTGRVAVFKKITVGVNSVTICEGETATLTAIGALTYKWSNGQTGSVINVNPITTTSYTVTGTAGGCTGTAIAVVTVNPAPEVTVVKPDPVCEGASVFLKATGATNYIWKVTKPNADKDTITLKIPFSQVITVYGITNGCMDSTTVLVTIDQRPNVDIASPTICLGGQAVLVPKGAHHYKWTVGGQTTDSIIVAPTQTTMYEVIGYSENGSCTDTAYAFVTVGPPVAVSISGLTDIYSCESTELSATPSDGTYTWRAIGFTDGKMSCETCPTTLVTPPYTLPYEVTYRSPAGCFGKDTILINVININSYFLATGFTPNGDGINDVVQVHGKGIERVVFMIFDRVGEKVFETREIETGWDGRLAGVPMNSGVFVYRLEIYYCSGETVKESGNITLLR